MANEDPVDRIEEKSALGSAVSETDSSPPRGNPFPIVGIGASAGGLHAFEQLLRAVPANTGMAFVIVSHLDPQHESLLAEILTPITHMPVETVSDGVAVQPNHVYVIPPNRTMELQDGHLRLVAREPGIHLPIDIFFRSLAKVQGSRAVGVVLSGNASDGSLGLQAIKAECGITFAQDENSARFGGMPRSAIATGAVDFILPPAEIGQELSVIGHHPFLVPQQPGDSKSETLPDGDAELRRIFALLNSTMKVDFSHYKPTTIRRRIGRRMMVLRIDSMADYVAYVTQHSGELRELYNDFLISVTSFFRDPSSFDALSKLLASIYIDPLQKEHTIRAWIPGCATGEEVYSLAICLHEMLESQHSPINLQLFGTDISPFALDRARGGIYSGGIAEDISPERLRRFFTKMDGGYQIGKMIRDCCVFARHDLTRDPPFSNLDLISCRNVLIYLGEKAQRRILPVFHYALKSSGLLLLGSAETVAAAPDLFLPSDKAHHIYSRRAVPTRMSLDYPAGQSLGDFSHGQVSTAASLINERDLHKKVDRLIQSRYSPDGVVVDAELQIVQFRGHTSPYLEPAPGEASLNLLRMAKETLVLPLRRAVQAAAASGDRVREAGISLEINERREDITIEVTPVAGGSPVDNHFLVVFVRNRPEQPPLEFVNTLPPAVDEQVGLLQRELAEARDYLRNITEEYEAHAEELKAANEEARSANEELQSTNEELGTTKEELQSANEELTTVNEELHNRNQELAGINSDLKNLLGAVTVAILMVDQDLRVRRFNAASEKLLDLGPLDIGRPVGHIRGRIETPRLEQQVRAVVDSLNATSEELQDSDGRWYSVAVRPYRTLDDRIAGAVITFQDIDPLKRGLQAAEEARDYAEGMIETVREPLVVLDADLRVTRATTAFYEAFLVSREETEGRFLYDLGNGQWNHQRLRELLGRALFNSEPFHDFQIEHDFPHIGRRTVRLNARRIPRAGMRSRTLLLAIEDVTELREIADIRFQRLFETAKDGIVVIDSETEAVLDVNAHFLEMTGFRRETLVGRRVADAGPLLGIPEVAAVMSETGKSEIVRRDDLQIVTNLGQKVAIDIVGNRYMVGNQSVVQLNIRDISARKATTHALRESEERFRLFVESVRDYALFQMDKGGIILSWNNGAERLLGWQEHEALGKSVELIFTPEDVQHGKAAKELEIARSQGRAEDERWHMRKDGSRFFASGVLTQVCDDNGQLVGFAKIMRDITLRREQEDQLRRSLEEKSMLVREIHHRVKNNLQVIVSLLSLQSNQADDPQVVAAFSDTESRVRAIANIHERLYASDDLTEVEFAAYLTDLARELVSLHSKETNQIELELDLQDMVLHIEQAVPLGLVANELIVNSLKHGLTRGAGHLKVVLEYIPGSYQPEKGETLDDGWARICVDDDGPGLPTSINFERTESMGFRLITLLVRQLRGRLNVGKGPGANLSVSFPLPPYVKKP